jgi:putative redox protein
MSHKIKSNFIGGMAFETDMDGHKIVVDAYPEFGGENKGPSPKPLVLTALSGCTGMDVVSLLKKMRVDYENFSIEIDASLTEEHPKYYDKIHVVYAIKVKPEDEAKVKKAVDLSQERYCGVSYMLSQSSELTYEILF